MNSAASVLWAISNCSVHQELWISSVIFFLWFPSKLKQLSWSISLFQELLITALSRSFCGFAGTFAVLQAVICFSFRAGYSSAGGSWSHANSFDLADHGGSLTRWWKQTAHTAAHAAGHVGPHLVPSSIRSVFPTLVSVDEIWSSQPPCSVVSVDASINHQEGWFSAAEAHLPTLTLWPLVLVGEPLLTRYFLY